MEFVGVIVLHQADRFTTAADRDFDAVEQHRTRRQRNRLQARGALAIDGGAADRDRQTGAQRGLARDVAAGGALLHGSAHHHVLDFLRIELGALDGVLNGMAEQGCAFGGVQRATIGLSDRRAGGGDDNGFGHERPPVASCSCSDGFFG